MDFSFSQETLMMQETLRKFITEEMIPLQEKHKLDREKPPPADLRMKMRKRAVELGFYGIDMPEEVGGMDIPAADRCLLFEESAKHDNVFATEVFGGAPGPTPILLACNDKQKEKYLMPLMKGDITTCFGLSEPGAGSDATNIQTTAVKKGDKWILNGRKHYITGAPVRRLRDGLRLERLGQAREGGHQLLPGRPRHARRRFRSPAAHDGRRRLGGRAGLRGLRGAGGQPARPGGAGFLAGDELDQRRAAQHLRRIGRDRQADAEA